MLTVLLLTAVTSAQAPCSPPDLQATTILVREAIFAGTATEVTGVLVDVERRMSCLERWTSPDELAAFYQASATVAALSLDADTARARFDTASRLAGAVPFDSSLGMVHEPGWQQAATRVSEGPHGMVGARTDVRVDGWILRYGEQRRVPAGQHIVQYTAADGRMITQLVDVEGDSDVLVGPIAPPRPRDANCEDPSFPRRHRRVFVGAGAAGLAGGAAMLVVGGMKLEQLGRGQGSGMTSDEQEPLVTSARAFTYGGLGVTVLGTGLLIAPAITMSF